MAADLLGAMRVEIVGDNKKLDKSINESEKKTKDFGKSTAKLGATLGKLFAGIGFALVAKKLFDLGKAAENLFQVQQLAETKLDATLKATSFAAGLTADELKRMASGLQEVTTFGDEATIGAQSLLLTFKDIGGEVFPRALESILDVSTAMGTGLKESSIQVGKALNDPVKGISALTRVGIQFTDVQKDLIKGFQESGDIAAAQGVILDELESQFGGLSRAAALTADGIRKQLNNSIGDLGEAVGESISGTLTPWRESLISIVEAFTELVSAQNLAKDFTKDFNDGIADNERSLEDLQSILESLETQRLRSRRGTSQDFKDRIIAVQKLIENYDHVNDRLESNNSLIEGSRQLEELAAKEKIKNNELSLIAKERLAELTAVELTEGEKQIGLLQEQIDLWAKYAEIPGVQELINELVAQRTELLKEDTEAIEDNSDAYLKKIESQEEADIEYFNAVIERNEERLKLEVEAAEEAEERKREARQQTIDLVSGGINAIDALQDAAAARELERLIKSGATEEEIEEKKIEIARENARREKLNALFEIGVSTASAIAKALPNIPLSIIVGGLGVAQAAAVIGTPLPFNRGGVVAGTQFGKDSVPAMLSPTETVMNPRQQAQILMAIANGGFSGNSGGGDNNTINISAMFSLGNDAQINQAAERLFPALQKVGRRRGATIGGTS